MEHEDLEKENLAQTLARELKTPQVLNEEFARTDVALPPGWKLEKIDNEALLVHPRRVAANAVLTTKDAFIEYVRVSWQTFGTVWCDLNPITGLAKFRAILDDHNPETAKAGWRAHTATFEPRVSVEWARWAESNCKRQTQADFARFLEEHQANIRGGDGFPDGGQMLAMALDFEAKQDSRFKSAIRTQSGSVAMEFVAADDNGTVQRMSVFERFRIAIPVFRDDGVRYDLVARLRYRAPEGKLTFWYELVRADLVFEQSCQQLIDYVRKGCDRPFFFGTP